MKKCCVPEGFGTSLRWSISTATGCCGSDNGYFVVYLDRKELVHGSKVLYAKRYTIQVNPSFEENGEWVTTHNRRRGKYNKEFGQS